MSKTQHEKLLLVKRAVSKYITALNKKELSVSEAFIYGSYAKGLARKESDVDVCIVSKAYNPDDQIRLLLWKTRRDIDVRIEPVGYRPEDFNETDPLVYEVKKYGIKVV
jgi:predicted nucleotidyltransferase